ncbi:hypothetical protein ACYCFK_03205 [Stutzerimonas stutzeri]
MSNIESRWPLQELGRYGDGLTAAGIGLESIGRLLNEGDLHADDSNGLQHAVMALGEYVRLAGYAVHARAEKLAGGEQ